MLMASKTDRAPLPPSEKDATLDIPNSAPLSGPTPRTVTPPPSSSRSSRSAPSLADVLHVDEQSVRRSTRPKVVGHRGALYQALENTRESFRLCSAMGCDFVELDVFQVKDELVVFHGSGTDEIPGDMSGYLRDGHGSICNLTYQEICGLEFNPHYAGFPCLEDKIRAGKIPTLKQVLLDLQPTDTKIKIELKGPGTVEPTIRLVETLDMVHQCMYVSYYHDRLQLLRKLRPMRDPITNQYIYQTGALFGEHVPDDFVDRALAVGATEVDLRYDTCTVERVEAIRKAGLRSMAWFRGPIAMEEDSALYDDIGNEDESCYQIVIATGVDELCVNRPEVLLNLLKNL